MSTAGNQQITDPIQIIGPSLLLQVFYFLPLRDLLNCSLVSATWYTLIDNHSTSIFRNLASDIVSDKKRIDFLKSLGQDEVRDSVSYNASFIRAGTFGSNKKISWRGICRDAVVTERNWKYGRAKPGWLTPGRNTVWRMKVDPEENVLYTVSRLDIAPYSHMEFTGGFVIFNIGLANALEVHLTPCAMRRLTPEQRQAIPPASNSETYGSDYSFTQEDDAYRDAQGSTEIPHRGHLTYYKTLRPATECWAFRARMDKEGQEGERPVLGTAGREAIYLFGLADAMVETIQIQHQHVDRDISYIEFDDEYVFICGPVAMHVYSRQTKQLLNFFPTSYLHDLDAQVQAVYELPESNEVRRLPSAFEGATRVSEITVKGLWKQDSAFENAERLISERMLLANGGFSACHFTSSDLFCANKYRVLFVVRDYKSVFSIIDKRERSEALSRNLLALRVKNPINQLYTNGERVVFNTMSEIYLLNASSLPPPPYNVSSSYFPQGVWPSIRILSFLDVHTNGLKHSSCLQMDGTKIYLVYWALGEQDGGGIVYDDGQAHLPPAHATADFGMCIKTWDFGHVDC
ncbi:hypothetical protein I307_04890 [Cryptococcus deuterogattii 99/473]|uniref:F-box domain-containing protein n=1 Tax=Cryptococcus deuterogattii Ram5 TaxID=1296110 RepID=A0A0D0V4Z5_9TREE|nr:hypothetical protein I352_05621 [Cryptococcus deuterogattii MMRL2647]KIR40010.1 hypothetical protein I313_03931 [Cryptococcus deuterogattii Ram5]KIR71404.1 hypothetical protein I310_04711 [Cryptococcus deuterogattii CA1014]KIR96264.1 hypothetical protein L804_06388 [Cryptococcus deuterogattii 2001/935-1]KIY55705.1 hypothetical protein I307_04890 [Cryptococcus deuterogattii 99/473]